ncbi:MAG: hypothetical protein RLZZ362_280, partial [Actinomycetota bacterium]
MRLKYLVFVAAVLVTISWAKVATAGDIGDASGDKPPPVFVGSARSV